LRAPTVAVIALALSLGGLAVALRAGRRPQLNARSWRPSLRDWGLDRWVVAATLVALAAYAVIGYLAAQVHVLDGWDSWSIWSRRGVMLLQSSSMPTAFFTSPDYTFMHPDYPLLLSLFDSTWFRAVGGPNAQSLHGQFWILFIAALWAAGYLASRVARPVFWAPVLALLAVTPAVNTQLLSLYADIPMALFLALGALAVGLWLHEQRHAYLALGTLLLAGAASTKNEGLSAAAIVLVGCLVVSVVAPRGARWRSALAPALALGGFLVAVAPWRLWLAAHHVTGDMPIGKGLSPGYLADRTERVWPSVNAIGLQLRDQAGWNYILPLGIALVAVCLVTGAGRRIAAFYAGIGLATFASIVWAYWISPNDLGWYLDTSVARTADAVVLLAIPAVLHLGGQLLPMGERPSGR
jgi:hypothetical protein